MFYRANGNFAERGSGRGGGPGGVRSTRCTLPGGVPGTPFFIGPRFYQLRIKNFQVDDLQPENHFVRGASMILSLRIPLSVEGSKKVKKRRISRKSQVVCFYTAGWFTRRNLHFLTPPKNDPFFGSFFKIKLLY